MTPLIQNLLTAGFHGSVIIAAVLLLRLILKKAPKRVVCVLWMLAFIRLLMPFQLESNFSLQPEAIPLEETTFYESVIEHTSPDNIAATDPQPNDDSTIPQPIIPESSDDNIAGEVGFVQSELEEVAPVHWTSVLPYFWLVGTFCCLLYAVVSYIQLKRTVREAVRIIGCWECDRIETAFILGYIRPRIYVPMGLSRRTRKHILAHEWAHLQTGDHWFKLLAYLACCLHWFNPLVWVAYRLMCKDMEHACDERVVRYMNLEARKQYSHALLTCSTNHGHYTPCPVAFGEVSVKSRILSVLNYRKPSFWITLIAVITVACVGVFLMTSPTSLKSSDNALPDEMMELADAIHAEPYLGNPEKEKLSKLLARVTPEPLTAPKVRKTVTVSNVDELLTALAPDTEIVLMPGTYKLWEAADYGNNDKYHSYYSWGNSNQLELYNLKNCILSGSGKGETVILAEPSEADVLLLKSCSNLYLKGITFGHATAPVQYSCSGYALSMRACMNMMMEDLGLYGCGVIGLYTDLCHNISISNSDIYDCSTSGIALSETYYADIFECNLYDIGTLQNNAGSIISVFGGSNVSVSNCQIENNHSRELISCNNNDALFQGNRFTDNHVSDGAFWFTQCSPVLNDNTFEQNELMNWYYEFSEPASDLNGKELTKEYFDSIHIKTFTPTAVKTIVKVSTIDDFLAAIAPNTEIVLEGELFDLSKATAYGNTNGAYYYWNPVHDGYELVIHNVNNMTICSLDDDMDKHSITAFPRYANVLHFQFCSNITLSGFTAGHAETGAACGGGVIRIDSSEQFTIDNCGLFGCGTIGIDASSSRSITVTECDIYECTTGGIFAHMVNDMEIKNTTFRDLGGYNGMSGYIIAPMECSNIIMDGEEVTDRINYFAEKVNADEISFRVNGEAVDSVSVYGGTVPYVIADVGTFLKIKLDGIPESTAVTWSYADSTVINAISHPDHCQVEVRGIGKAVLTALCGNVRKDIVITGTIPTDAAAVNSDICITYDGQSLTECTAAVGDSIEFGTENLSSDNSYIINWSSDNRDAISVEYTSQTTCTVHIIGTGEATLAAYELPLSEYDNAKYAAVKIHCRESW